MYYLDVQRKIDQAKAEQKEVFIKLEKQKDEEVIEKDQLKFVKITETVLEYKESDYGEEYTISIDKINKITLD